MDVDPPRHAGVRHLGRDEGTRRLRREQQPEPGGLGRRRHGGQLPGVLEVGAQVLGRVVDREQRRVGRRARPEPVPVLRLLARPAAAVHRGRPPQQVVAQPQVVAALDPHPGRQQRRVPPRGVVPHPARRVGLARPHVRRQVGHRHARARRSPSTTSTRSPGRRESETRVMGTPWHPAVTPRSTLWTGPPGTGRVLPCDVSEPSSCPPSSSPAPSWAARRTQGAAAMGAGHHGSRGHHGTPSWKESVIDADQSFRGLDAVDRRTAWVTGGSATEGGPGRVFRTTDGGRTWQDVSPPGTEGLLFRDVEARSATERRDPGHRGGRRVADLPHHRRRRRPGTRRSSTTTRRRSTTAWRSTPAAGAVW